MSMNSKRIDGIARKMSESLGESLSKTVFIMVT